MLEIRIPGFGELRLAHLVLDYNGTLACDGVLLDGVRERLERLARNLDIHVITADTFGQVRKQMEGVPCQIIVIAGEEQDIAKEEYLLKLEPTGVVAIGNGRNDRRMLAKATLGIAVMGTEGLATEALHAAHLVAPDICSALDLLLHPLRLVATLRC